MPFRFPANLLRILRVCAGVAAALLAAPVAAPAASTDSPEAAIRTYQAALLSTMKQARALGFQGRQKALRGPVSQAFDLSYVARRAAGRHWRKFSADQRTRYVAAFSDLTIATHAARFKGFGGETFRILGTDDPGRGYRLVKTHLTRPGKAPVSINYLMQKRGGAWKIIDVFLKGTISEVATRRADFASTLASQGPDALIRQIRAKVAKAGG